MQYVSDDAIRARLGLSAWVSERAERFPREPTAEDVWARSVIACKHPDLRFGWVTYANGQRNVYAWCSFCEKRTGPLRKAEYEHRAAGELPKGERTACDRANLIACEWYARSKQDERMEWWAKYSAYLKTPDWGRRRAAVLQRDGNMCTAQLPGCRQVASQAHHITYAHVFNEPLFDLRAVCVPCHEAITTMDRAARGEGA